MFNAQRQNVNDLPTTSQLLRAAALAAVSAGVILVTVILPSEYAIDPTGIGRALGLTEMGEIKIQLAEEAAADAAMDAANAAPALAQFSDKCPPEGAGASRPAPAASAISWRLVPWPLAGSPSPPGSRARRGTVIHPAW